MVTCHMQLLLLLLLLLLDAAVLLLLPFKLFFPLPRLIEGECELDTLLCHDQVKKNDASVVKIRSMF
jgi:hypothetical protein